MVMGSTMVLLVRRRAHPSIIHPWRLMSSRRLLLPSAGAPATAIGLPPTAAAEPPSMADAELPGAPAVADPSAAAPSGGDADAAASIAAQGFTPIPPTPGLLASRPTPPVAVSTLPEDDDADGTADPDRASVSQGTSAPVTPEHLVRKPAPDIRVPALPAPAACPGSAAPVTPELPAQTAGADAAQVIGAAAAQTSSAAADSQVPAHANEEAAATAQPAATQTSSGSAAADSQVPAHAQPATTQDAAPPASGGCAAADGGEPVVPSDRPAEQQGEAAAADAMMTDDVFQSAMDSLPVIDDDVIDTAFRSMDSKPSKKDVGGSWDS